ncbi:MAG: hypothetical protein ACYDGM_13700, partial [Vulcanimicrobiaceae bacterium]
MSTTLPAPQQKRERYWPTVEQQQAVAEYFIDEFVGDATGTAAGDVCMDGPPRSKYFLATLAPQQDDEAGLKRENNAMGFEMEVQGETELQIEAEFSVYYRIFPTYAEQIARWPIGDEKKDGKKVVKWPLASVYKRYPIGPVTITIPVGTRHEAKGRELFEPFFKAAGEAAQQDGRAFRRGIKDVPRDALTDEPTYEAYLRANSKEHV